MERFLAGVDIGSIIWSSHSPFYIRNNLGVIMQDPQMLLLTYIEIMASVGLDASQIIDMLRTLGYNWC